MRRSGVAGGNDGGRFDHEDEAAPGWPALPLGVKIRTPSDCGGGE